MYHRELGSNCRNDMQATTTGDARCARYGPETMKSKCRDEKVQGKGGVQRRPGLVGSREIRPSQGRKNPGRPALYPHFL